MAKLSNPPMSHRPGAESGKPERAVVPRKGRAIRRRNLYGWLFIAPWAAGLLLFYMYPLVSSLFMSFTSYSILKAGHWVGLQNYRELFGDDVFRRAVANTVYYTLLYVPLSIAGGVLLALAMNAGTRGIGLYRTVIFFPSLVPLVAKAVIWSWMLNPQAGLVNRTLGLLGIQGPPWLSSPEWAKPTLVLMSLWALGQMMIIFLAGLKDISREYYDAAAVDGAHWFQRLFRITLPLLTPVIFYNMVMGLIGSLQIFALPYALTSAGGTAGIGAPAGSMMFYVMHLYQNAFMYLNMGYASAMSALLFVAIALLTAVIFATSRRWVHYQGEE